MTGSDTDEHFAAIATLGEKYPKLKGIEILPYHDMGNSKRISIGAAPTLTEIKTVLPEVAAVWQERVRGMG